MRRVNKLPLSLWRSRIPVTQSGISTVVHGGLITADGTYVVDVPAVVKIASTVLFAGAVA